MIVTEEALVWGSDDDEGQPAIFRFTPETGELVRLRDLDNPSYHAGRLADGTMAITTTYEPLSPFTRAQSPPASSSLWISRDGMDWTRVLTLEGDSAHWSAGKRPQIQIPSGDPLPALFLTPWFTEQWDFAALRLRSGDAVGEEAARAGTR
jgi:hypothetical protein